MTEVFSKLKLRWLLLWLVVCGAIFLVLDVIFIPADAVFLNDYLPTILIIYAVPLVWFGVKLHREGFGFGDFLRHGAPGGFSFSNYVGASIVPLLMAAGILLLISGLLMPLVGGDISASGDSFPVAGPGDLALEFVVTVLIAPICEEYIFRGLLVGRLMYKWGPKTGILVSSLIFGFGHGVDFIGKGIAGIVLCLIFLKTRSLIWPMAVHATGNFLVFLRDVWFYADSSAGAGAAADMPSQGGLLVTGGILTLICCAWMFPFIDRYWPAALHAGYPEYR